MNILERAGIAIRHAPALERPDWLSNRIRPTYGRVLSRKTVPDSWLLVCAIAISISARLYFASRPEIGLDDATSADIAALPVGALVRFVMWNEPTMGLYYILLHFWSAIAGNSPLTLRIFSILFSVATVPAIYFLGREAFNSSVGLTAAFLLAANATAVDFAQVIKAYSLVILLVVASSFFFVKLIQNPKAKITDAWAYIIFSTICIYTHMHAVFTLISHALSACFSRTAPWRTLIASGIIVGLVALPLPLATFGHYQGQSDWATQVRLTWMAKIVPFLCGAPLFTKTPSAILLTLSSTALVAIGWFASDFSQLWSRIFAINCLVAPIVLCALLSLAKPAFFGAPRYLLICLPFLVLLVALGIQTFHRPAVVLCSVMVLELWQVALRPAQYQTPTNLSCWSEATDYLFSNARSGDRVIVSSKYDAWRYWYYEALHDQQHTQLRLVFPNWDREFSVGGVYVDNNRVPEHPPMKWFESEKSKVGRLWIIIDPSRDSASNPLWTSIHGQYVETQRTFPDGLQVLLLETRSSGRTQTKSEVAYSTASMKCSM